MFLLTNFYNKFFISIYLHTRLHLQNFKTFRFYSESPQHVHIQKMVNFKLNDKVEFKAKTKYDIARLNIAYQDYQINSANTSGNTTLLNPYNNLNLTFLTDGSGISFLYVPMFEESKGWYAFLQIDAPIPNTGDYNPIQMWQVPSDNLASGSGSKTVDSNGVYIIMATIYVENVEEIQLSFMKGDQLYCDSILKCTQACNDDIIFSCIVQISAGVTLDLYTKTNNQGVKVKKNSFRKINYFGDVITSFSMAPSKSYDLTTSTEWQEIGPWDTSNVNLFGLFVTKISNYYNEFVFRESGTFHVTLNLLLQVNQRPSDCSSW